MPRNIEVQRNQGVATFNRQNSAILCRPGCELNTLAGRAGGKLAQCRSSRLKGRADNVWIGPQYSDAVLDSLMFMRFQLTTSEDSTDNVCYHCFLDRGEAWKHDRPRDVEGEVYFLCVVMEVGLQSLHLLSIPVLFCLPELMQHVQDCAMEVHTLAIRCGIVLNSGGIS